MNGGIRAGYTFDIIFYSWSMIGLYYQNMSRLVENSEGSNGKHSAKKFGNRNGEWGTSTRVCDLSKEFTALGYQSSGS